jgi:DNA-binding transcriptional regulator YiaG
MTIACNLADRLATIGWSMRHLADRLHCAEGTVRTWARRGETPEDVARWLDTLVQAHTENPAPDWRNH